MKLGITFIISISLFILLFFSIGKIFFCKQLSCMTMNGLSNFKIKDIYQEDKNTFRALYTNKDKMLRVEIKSQIDQFTADQYINANIAQIKGLFTDALAPYPGVASKTITCDIKYHPLFDKITTTNKLDVIYFIAYLNHNLIYGSCTEPQVIYKAISVYFYCSKNKQTFHLEIIAPKKAFELSVKDYQNTVKSIKCN